MIYRLVGHQCIYCCRPHHDGRACVIWEIVIHDGRGRRTTQDTLQSFPPTKASASRGEELDLLRVKVPPRQLVEQQVGSDHWNPFFRTTRVRWSGDILYAGEEKPWEEKGYNGVQNVASLPHFGLVINNGALGIAIVVVAFRSTTTQIGNFTRVFDFSNVACEYNIIFSGFYIPFPISMGTCIIICCTATRVMEQNCVR